MSERQVLPQRRPAMTFDFHARGGAFTATIGFRPDGRIGEVFLNGLKRDTDSDHDGRDIAILISFALQHGAEPGDLAKAMTRSATGEAQGLAGGLIDAILAAMRDDAEAASEATAHSNPERQMDASEARRMARERGYAGEACRECGNYTLVRNGTCLKCDTCGATTGCS